MTKKAIITVSLVSEAQQVSNETIKKEILKDSQIPWGKQILEIVVEEEKG